MVLKITIKASIACYRYHTICYNKLEGDIHFIIVYLML